MHDKSEYDARLGGTVQLPEMVSTFKFSADRVDEIKSLLGAINHPQQTKLVFQKLPKHMRRRAMSHNPKRLPRKYRAAHIAQMRKSGVATISKRPSRKYRRKAGNLQKEYARRAKKHVWLETHLWHAKRFHMVEKWGYKLAESSCDKTFRSSYRASAEHCLLQDISYVGCVEIAGRLDVIRDAFARVTSTACGLGVCARTFVEGCREGSVELFREGAYPLGAVGKASFLWRPADSTDIRALWLFVHPAFYKDVVELFQHTFQLVENDAKSLINTKTGLRLLELKDKLNRFRLTGLLSQAVLSKAFKCKTTQDLTADNWFTQSLTSAKSNSAHQSQSAYWKHIESLASPNDLIPNMVLALNIEDPRLNRPQKRTKALPDHAPKGFAFTPTIRHPSTLRVAEHGTESALWDHTIRAQCSREKMSTHEFCLQRNKHVLVPGERCAFENDMQAVPLLLVQRPGAPTGKLARAGYGCGWDIVLPAEYGISTWMCLIMWGARAGGLRETETVHRESGTDEFLPDTVPAKYIAESEHERLRNEFFKRPQNKRPNFTKLSINSPFLCRWSQLTADWTQPSTSEFYVIREPAQLQQIQQILARRLPLTALAHSVMLRPNCLIPVHIKMAGRGCLDNRALICLPKPSDLRRRNRGQTAAQLLDAAPVHTEPMRGDAGETERKQLRAAHLRLLTRLRRRRVRAKRLRQETAERRVLIGKPGTAKLVAEQLAKMRELWLPADVQQVRHQCGREVLGYATQANFGLSVGTVAGVGYITLMGMRKLVLTMDKVMGGQGKKKKGGGGGCQVLVRGTQTRQYRLAGVEVSGI